MIKGAEKTKYVFAYHEIIAVPEALPVGYAASRCEVHYRGSLSPDFYGWVFPHGASVSVGTGSADKGFSLRRGVMQLRKAAGLAEARTLRHMTVGLAGMLSRGEDPGVVAHRGPGIGDGGSGHGGRRARAAYQTLERNCGSRHMGSPGLMPNGRSGIWMSSKGAPAVL